MWRKGLTVLDRRWALPTPLHDTGYERQVTVNQVKKAPNVLLRFSPMPHH